MIQATIDKAKDLSTKRPILTGSLLAVLLPALLTAGVNTLNITIGETTYALSLTGPSQQKQAEAVREVADGLYWNGVKQGFASCERAFTKGDLTVAKR